MYFNICNDVNIKNFKLKGQKSILIRLLEPSYLVTGIPYDIDNIHKYKSILELYITDSSNENSIYNFDIDKAKLLNNFILINDFDEVVVHCSLGISRSPAIMICIAKILNNIELETLIKEKYKNYNSYIVKVFENYKYIIKELVFPIVVEGNILNERFKNDNISLIRIIK